MNPIYEENGKWYFWDETWTNSRGPYDSIEEVKEDFDRYLDVLNTDDENYKRGVKYGI